MIDIINSLIDFLAFFGENIAKVIKENIGNANLILFIGIGIICGMGYKSYKR